MTNTDQNSLIDLISNVSIGDQESFDALYEATAPHVFGLAQTIVQNGARAELVTQDVFQWIWDHAEQFDPRNDAQLWIKRIAVQTALSRRAAVEGGQADIEVDMDIPLFDGPALGPPKRIKSRIDKDLFGGRSVARAMGRWAAGAVIGAAAAGAVVLGYEFFAAPSLVGPNLAAELAGPSASYEVEFQTARRILVVQRGAGGSPAGTEEWVWVRRGGASATLLGPLSQVGRWTQSVDVAPEVLIGTEVIISAEPAGLRPAVPGGIVGQGGIQSP